VAIFGEIRSKNQQTRRSQLSAPLVGKAFQLPGRTTESAEHRDMAFGCGTLAGALPHWFVTRSTFVAPAEMLTLFTEPIGAYDCIEIGQTS